MTWFGTVSAWGAVVVGVLFLAGAMYEGAAGGSVGAAVYVAAAGLLLLGGYRTLSKRSGGLRLLCGAWGIVVGIQAPLLVTLLYQLRDYLDSNFIFAASVPFAEVRLVVFFVALVGLAFTVLHKETK